MMEANLLSLVVSYDDHYCRYFASHASTWTLYLSDEMRNSLKAPAPEKQTVVIPKGLGGHIVRVGAGGIAVEPSSDFGKNVQHHRRLTDKIGGTG